MITCDLRQKIVTVLRHMVDNYRQIFKISEEIQREVEREIEREVERERERERFVRHSYCQRVTQQMYEIQKDTIVQRELEALLDNIVRDENMSTKVKKQRLKQVIIMCIYVSICLPTYLSAYLCIYLPTYISICLPMYLSAYLCIYLPTYVYICLPMYLYFSSNVHILIFIHDNTQGVWIV